MTYLWVAIGGGIGAVLRFAVVQWVTDRASFPFPWGTLVVNLTGSLVIGFLLALLIARDADPTLRFLLVTGVLGGYTTFSAFSYEVLSLLQEARWLAALFYALGSVVLGLVAAAVGYWLATTLG